MHRSEMKIPYVFFSLGVLAILLQTMALQAFAQQDQAGQCLNVQVLDPCRNR